jgi:hypothetical protein
VLAPFAGFAEPTHPNEIGLYTESWDGYGPTGTNIVGTPWSGIVAFDCQLNFNPIGGIFKIGDVLNGEGFNIGDAAHIGDGFLEYIVGFAYEIPSINDAILLTTLQFINQNTGPVEVTMGPASVPSVPGQMSYVTPNASLQVMYSMGGAMDAPVFIFNGEAVPVEQESFGSVKALYR